MTAVTASLLTQLIVAAVAALGAFVLPARWRPPILGLVSALLSTVAGMTGVLAMTGGAGAVSFPTTLTGLLTFAPDRLGGLFMVIVSIVGVLASIYAMRSDLGSHASRVSWAAWALFLAGMQLIPAAADMVSFLLAWELMTLCSLILLASRHPPRPALTSATIWYLAMSQLSFFLVMAGFAVLASAAGGTSFAAVAGIEPGSWQVDVAFLLLLVGFAAKAELVPLHVWVPRVLPEAPAPLAAAMSGAMVKVGVYGAVLVCVRLLPVGPPWWGVLIMVLGGVSAVYGILQASVNSGLKVLLAYSTTENMGLVFLAVGASVLLRGYDATAAADAALLAALLLTISHALFKTTLFLAAGAIEHATGDTNLDGLGGLLGRMPWTAAAFGIAALAAAALPVTSGFVAEWTLLQSLIHGSRIAGTPVAVVISVAMPFGVAVVALTAGLALLTFVKAYGIAFLARPRSTGAATALEIPTGMRVPLVVGAVAIIALGVLPGPVAGVVASTVLSSPATAVRSVGLAGISIPGIGVLLDPAALAVIAALLAVPVLIVVRVAARRHPGLVTPLPWGGGGSRARPRMQYTATSYAEPLVRVFDDVLKPSRDVQVTHLGESRYLIERMQIEQRVTDVFETRLYRPVLNAAERFGRLARHAQNGSIHRYLAYSFAALLIVLVVVAL
jgi:hydrogenase-4 component B